MTTDEAELLAEIDQLRALNDEHEDALRKSDAALEAARDEVARLQDRCQRALAERDQAQGDADRYVAQLKVAGIAPAPLVDGDEAGDPTRSPS